jgi:hypothetical protein
MEYIRPILLGELNDLETKYKRAYKESWGLAADAKQDAQSEFDKELREILPSLIEQARKGYGK